MEGISEKGEGRNGILEEASIAHGLLFGVGFLDLWFAFVWFGDKINHVMWGPNFVCPRGIS